MPDGIILPTDIEKYAIRKMLETLISSDEEQQFNDVRKYLESENPSTDLENNAIQAIKFFAKYYVEDTDKYYKGEYKIGRFSKIQYCDNSGHSCGEPIDLESFDEFDMFILGWIYYFYNAEGPEKGYLIKPNMIKAMMREESQMTHARAKDVNKNINHDVMQCLDPRNANVYEYTNGINPDDGRNIIIDSGYEDIGYRELYGLGEGENPGNKPIIHEYIRVCTSLFKEENEKYVYQYNKSSVFLSTGIGISKYILLYKKLNKNEVEAAVEYNGGGDISYWYQNNDKNENTRTYFEDLNNNMKSDSDMQNFVQKKLQ